MRKILIVTFLILLLIPFSFSDVKKTKQIPERYRKWLEEEVFYIITPREKEVFLQLETDRERDIFIEAFWKARDPDPATPANEFKDEHYRRISYANQYFGRLSPTPGWKTDRGKVYIILGEPNQIEKYDNLPDVYPVEVWFYQGLGKYGLPNAFYILFFRRDDASEYEIYSPVKDGPRTLLRFFEMYRGADPLNFEYAYRLLYQAKPELAIKALSLIPGDERTTSPSLASEVLLSNITQFPFRRVKDEYAEKLLKYKEFIEVDYSANYIENSSLCSVILEENGFSFIHYLIEPKKFSVEFSNGNYRTFLEIHIRLSDLKGKTVYQITRKLPIILSEREVTALKSNPVSIQGIVPVAEGNYKFSVILKNLVSKEFTLIESDINSTPFPRTITLTPLILGYGYKEENEKAKKGFKIGNGKIFLSSFPNFSNSETMHVLFSIIGSEKDLKKCSNVRFAFVDEKGNILKEKTEPLKSYSRRSIIVHQAFELKDLNSGNFKLIVEIKDTNGTVLLTETKDFGISATPFLPRPLIYSEPFSADEPTIYFILGSQYFNKGENERALEFFKNSYSKNPLNQKFAIGYAKSLFVEKKYFQIKEILSPFINVDKKEPDTYELLGLSYMALGEYNEAIEIYKQFLSHFGLKLSVLNSLGECYLKTGDKENALYTFEKSLEINPEQDAIKKIVAGLREK
ncbi:MAG: GWxTD domain-containing protein [Candidatus Aminicenantia bacterium]